MKRKIAIIGCGVSGLTCAVELAREFNVTVLADRIVSETDSVKATAIWHVYLVPETETVYRWARESLDKLYDLAKFSPQAGVEIVTGIELFRKGRASDAHWTKVPRKIEFLTEEELLRFNTHKGLSQSDQAQLDDNPVIWGCRMDAPAVNMANYLNWLYQEAINMGVKFERKRVNSLKEVGQGYDLIVNCTSAGARDLVSDNHIVPYKGQYYVIQDCNKAVQYISDEHNPKGISYLIPRNGDILVGGSAEEGVSDEESTIPLEAFMDRLSPYVPWLENVIAEHNVISVIGSRPFRSIGVRLELDRSVADIPVIHNYGHGGSGFSLSWGCSNSVSELAKNTIGF